MKIDMCFGMSKQKFLEYLRDNYNSIEYAERDGLIEMKEWKVMQYANDQGFIHAGNEYYFVSANHELTYSKVETAIIMFKCPVERPQK